MFKIDGFYIVPGCVPIIASDGNSTDGYCKNAFFKKTVLIDKVSPPTNKIKTTAGLGLMALDRYNPSCITIGAVVEMGLVRILYISYRQNHMNIWDIDPNQVIRH